MKTTLKLALIATSIAVLSACGGGGEAVIVADQPHSFFSVDNIASYGVVCVEDLFIEATSTGPGAQVAVDIANFYGLSNPFANPTFLTYSGSSYCGDPAYTNAPAPGLIIDASYYYNVIVPQVR